MSAAGEAGGAPPGTMDGIPEPGTLVGGKFVVEGMLGVGGMGVVVAARHAQLGQAVAIKFLRLGAFTNPESVNRFLREARASVNLRSAHVVRVMDVGTLDNGLPYMVMEHLTGTDLGVVIEARRTLPVDEAVDYVLQAMEAVAEAHALGIVHRDLKPANLFVTARPDGSPLVKVLDFGISKATGAGVQLAALTSTTAILGSPLYMSPEQVRSTKSVDPRTDIWALGVILHELISGSLPFEADTMTGLCAKIAADPPTALRSIRPDVPAGLEAVVGWCLEKDVARRCQTVGELAMALVPFASAEGKTAAERIARIGGPVSAQVSYRADPSRPASLPGVAVLPGPGVAETVATWQTTGGARRRRWSVIGLAVVLLGAAAATATLRTRAKGKEAAAGIVPQVESASVDPASMVAVRPAVRPEIIGPPEVLAPVVSASAPGTAQPPAASASSTRAGAPAVPPPRHHLSKPATAPVASGAKGNSPSNLSPGETLNPEDLLLDRK